ncbi:zinc-binding protein [Tritonibacter multivorans]|uniref:DNA gyrase inhibitor YacG n=1 Tax=Tritonibacter multivorans TaxID=928856 RepID=A0A0P1FZQ8_9RHOB|nr:DNA gyrase inhibitor YacG [Tritonibacter multivorans]MDA7422966.1 DNA gyrase inhibitor YacG [Tritonibacter multivorans]CUH74630.1 zinc-binding protein [Tritonibacter multivorans]SFD71891.1 hypothetical protein SAMN04488049_1245 [Tritonibacter multivorans]
MSCPICGEDTRPDFRPFCSRRCADIDLVRWMNGTYAVPSTEQEDLENALENAMREGSEKENAPH